MVTFLKDSEEMFRLENREEQPDIEDDTLIPFAPSSANGPEPDLERMMDSYGNGLLRLCFMYLKDTQLAEDAVQDTFLKVYRHYDSFGGGTGEKAWVTRIAINVCKDILRSAWKRRVNITEELNEIPDLRQQPDKADDTLICAVMALKPMYKEVILLFYYEDMKISEIAQVLSTPESTISVRLKRAREQLKKQLGGWYFDEE